MSDQNRNQQVPITKSEAKRFADLVKSGVPATRAAEKIGRSNYTVLIDRAVSFGFLEGRMSGELAAVGRTKITRVLPLPKGSALTWGEMMPDISWAEAERMTAHMRVY